MSNTASTVSSPFRKIASTATSIPGTYSSTMISPSQNAAMRARAAKYSSSSLHRMTPRLPERPVGFTTHG